MADCPDPNTILELVEGLLPAGQVAALDRHIDRCPACCALVAELARDLSEDEQAAPRAQRGPTNAAQRAGAGVSRAAPATDTAERSAPAAGPEGSFSFPPGTQVDHFRIMRPLGRGGMGEVYLARDTTLGRKVALKFINPLAFGSPTAASRFLFEAQATARCSHPNIVTIHAVGDFADRPYVALEYLEGRTLAERIREDPPSPRDALRIGVVLAEALHEAHRQKILHLDLKPANVMLTRDGRVIVLDFGLARSTRQRSRDARGGLAPTDPSFPMITPDVGSAHPGGTPHYMAPEQWSGAEWTTATDVWALGVMLFELARGRHPFVGKTLKELIAAVTDPRDVPQPNLTGTDYPALGQLIQRCLERDPARRPTTDEIAATCRRLLHARADQPASQSPFRGLLPFTERHAALFFGRDEETTSFLERLRDQPAVAVVGPSGVGKSSFVQAGVIPRLKEQGSWSVIQLRPGRRPLSALAGELLRRTHHAVDPQQLERLVARLRANPRQLTLSLYELAERRRARILLYVDQMEEVYALAESEQRESFAQAVCLAADDPQDPIRVVFSIRDDFLFRLAESWPAREAISRICVLRSPGPEALAETLLRPLEAVSFRFEDRAMPAEMAAEVQGSIACLPLLQFGGEMLWQRRDRERRVLGRAAYREMGGVAGALAQHADGVLAGLSAGELALARTLFLRLVTPEGTRRVLGRGALLEGLGDAAEGVLGRLTTARLITSMQAEEEGEARLELVHESLLATWKQLRRWIEESKEELVFFAEVAQAAELWEKRGRRPEEVWQGEALADAWRAVERCATGVIPRPGLVFLEAGRAAQAQRRRRRRIRLGAGVAALALVAVGAVIAAITMAFQKREVEQRRAQALQEGARSAMARGDVLEARAKLRLSLEAQDATPARVMWWRLARDPLIWRKSLGTQVYHALHAPDGLTIAASCGDRTLSLFDARTGQRLRTLRGHRDQVLHAAFSPDGRLLASGSWDGELRLWDPRRGELIRRVAAEGAVGALRFSPDGRLLAWGGRAGVIHISSAATGETLRTIRAHTLALNAVRFSPDGRWLGSSSADGTVRLWEVSSGSPRWVARAHGSAVHGLSFTPDGSRIVSGGRDRAVRVWDTASGALQQTLRGHRGTVRSVAVSPDGTLIASASEDHDVRLWDAHTGAPRAVLRGHTETVWPVDFSPDGKRLISAGADKTIRRWNIAAAGLPDARGGHTDQVDDAWFSPDGKLIASGAADATIRLWDVWSGRPLKVLRGHESVVWRVAFSPDGTLIASCSPDETVRLWDLRSGAARRILSGHFAPVYGVAFSPDGKSLASGGVDRKIRLWDVASGAPLRTLSGHTASVTSVRFSPDGAVLASSSTDRTVRLWDVTSGAQTAVLRGHHGPVYDIAFSPNGQQLLSGGEDRAVRLWDLASRSGQIVAELDVAPASSLSFHPEGQRVGLPGTDHLARIRKLGGSEEVVLRGHLGAVKSVRFDRRGKLVVTTSDDGTVRVWDADTGKPYWRATALVEGPVALAGHFGWRALASRGAGSAALFAARWRRAISERGRSADAIAGSPLLCLQTDDEHLQLWDRAADGLLLERKISGLAEVVALPDGCVGRPAVGATSLFSRDGAEVSLAGEASAAAWDGAAVLVAARGELIAFSARGARQRAWPVDRFVTAVGRAEPWLVVGYADGKLELLSPSSGARRVGFSFEDTPASPALRVRPGPRGTLFVGFASGLLGLWDLQTGAQLERARLHGPLLPPLQVGSRLYAATVLGQHLAWDLDVLHTGYCDVLRQVWRQIPVVWRGGLPAVEPPPAAHPCR